MLLTISQRLDAGGLLQTAASWQWKPVGAPWYVVVPLAALAFIAIRRFQRAEVRALPAADRRGLSLLRGAAAAVLVLLFLEPTCSYQTELVDPPLVAVLLDVSGSMGVKDLTMSAHNRLNEAVALGLAPAEARGTRLSDAAARIEAAIEDAPVIALSSLDEGLPPADEDASRRVRAAAARTAAERARGLRTVRADVAGMEGMAEWIDAAADLLDSAARRLKDETPGGPVSAKTAKRMADDFLAFKRDGPERARRQRRAQAAADEARVAGAGADSPVSAGLKQLDRMDRLSRSRQLFNRVVRPALGGRAQVRLFSMDRGLAELGVGDGHAAGPTDFEGALAALARTRSDSNLRAVLLLTDGRQTAGGDPVPVARALRARGARLDAIAVGDPETPRDAVVAEITGNTECFRGETLRLDVRFRITGFRDRPWRLVLSRDGGEIARRVVRGTGQWQQERFEFPADAAGVQQVQARLVPMAQGPVDAEDAVPSGLVREFWTGLPGSSVDDLRRHPDFPARPSGRGLIHDFEAPSNWAENYGSRLRGWILPPVTGAYTFWIAADDAAELWLSTDDAPASKTLIARAPEPALAREWNKRPSQQSRPMALSAGRRYYIEVLHKEALGFDHAAVGWQLPDGRLERPIPALRLRPWEDPSETAHASGDDESGEASLDNNQAVIAVSVSEDPLRVLLVDAAPRWDSRYLAALFDRDRRVKVDRRYRAVRLPRGEPELLPATQEELDAYDVLVLGDLKPEDLSPEDPQRIAGFVTRRGGFLVVLAGRRGMPADYSLGGLADVLPVRAVPQALPDPRADGRRYRLALADGGDSPITAVLDDPDLNRRLWPALAPMTWIARPIAAKKGADTLLSADDRDHTPVVVTARYGAGRVLYLGADETWRWRDRLGERVHQTFWLQAIRWGLAGRLRGRDPRLQVALDRAMLAPGETAELRARVRHADGSPHDVPLVAVIERLDDKGQPIPGAARSVDLEKDPASPEMRRAAIRGLEEGFWRVVVRAAHQDLAGIAETRTAVVRQKDSLEGIDLGADRAGLARLTEAGGGRVAGFDQAAAMARDLAAGLEPRRVSTQVTHSLWDTYAVLFIVGGLLMIEWVWRKRRGLP
jgi:uncharacterized membrane protein